MKFSSSMILNLSEHHPHFPRKIIMSIACFGSQGRLYIFSHLYLSFPNKNELKETLQLEIYGTFYISFTVFALARKLYIGSALNILT